MSIPSVNPSSSSQTEFQPEKLTGIETFGRIVGLAVGIIFSFALVGLLFVDSYKRWIEELRTGERKVTPILPDNLSGKAAKVESVSSEVMGSPKSSAAVTGQKNVTQEKSLLGEVERQQKEAQEKTEAERVKAEAERQQEEAQEKARQETEREKIEQTAMSREDEASRELLETTKKIKDHEKAKENARQEAERAKSEQFAMSKEDQASGVLLETTKKIKEPEKIKEKAHAPIKSMTHEPAKEVSVWQRSFDEVIKLSTPSEERYKFTLGHLASGSGMSKIVDLVDTFELEGRVNLQGLKHWEKLEFLTELFGSSHESAAYVRQEVLKELMNDLDRLSVQKSTQFENVLTYLYLYKDVKSPNRNNFPIGAVYTYIKTRIEQNKNYQKVFAEIAKVVSAQQEKVPQLAERNLVKYRPDQLSLKSYLINQKKQKEIFAKEKELQAKEQVAQAQEQATRVKAKADKEKRQKLLELPGNFADGPSAKTQLGAVRFKAEVPTKEELEAIIRNPEQQNVKLLAARFSKLSDKDQRAILNICPLYIQVYMLKHLMSLPTAQKNQGWQKVASELRNCESASGELSRLTPTEVVKRLLGKGEKLAQEAGELQTKAQNFKRIEALLREDFRKVDIQELLQLLKKEKRGGWEKIIQDLQSTDRINNPLLLRREIDQVIGEIDKKLRLIAREIMQISALADEISKRAIPSDTKSKVVDLVGEEEKQKRLADAIEVLNRQVSDLSRSLTDGEKNKINTYLESGDS